MVERESWDSYFMRIALMAASRATCLRRKVGCVLVQNHSVKGTGYNGAPRGILSCQEAGECLLDAKGHCIRCLHAETNLILQTDQHERMNSTVYLTDRPCWNCAMLLANSDISKIVHLRSYWDQQAEFEALMHQANIDVAQYQPATAVDLTVEDGEAWLGAAVNHPGLVVDIAPSGS